MMRPAIGLRTALLSVLLAAAGGLPSTPAVVAAADAPSALQLIVRDGQPLAAVALCRRESAGRCWTAVYDVGTRDELWHRRLAPKVGAVASVRFAPPYEPMTDSLFVTIAGRDDLPVTYALEAGSGAVQWVRRSEPLSRRIVPVKSAAGPAACSEAAPR